MENFYLQLIPLSLSWKITYVFLSKLLNILGTPGRILESTLLCKNNLLSPLIGRESSIICLILIFFCYLRVMSHVPPPPPPPTAPPVPEQSVWRKRTGQDYWEKALSSFHSLIRPPVPSTPPLPQHQHLSRPPTSYRPTTTPSLSALTWTPPPMSS